MKVVLFSGAPLFLSAILFVLQSKYSMVIYYFIGLIILGFVIFYGLKIYNKNPTFRLINKKLNQLHRQVKNNQEVGDCFWLKDKITEIKWRLVEARQIGVNIEDAVEKQYSNLGRSNGHPPGYNFDL